MASKKMSLAQKVNILRASVMGPMTALFQLPELLSGLPLQLIMPILF